MHTIYHFKSTDEITDDVVASIKIAFKGKAVVLSVEEETADITDWHKQLVYERLEEIKDNPAMLLTEEAFKQKMQQLKK